MKTGWIKETKYPTMFNPNSVDGTSFERFIKHFGLTRTFNSNPREFFNPEQFMKGTPYYNSGAKKQELFPRISSFEHLAAYKDEDNHVLIISHPRTYDSKEILNYMRKKGWVTVICDRNKRFYNHTDENILLIMTKETFEFFDSNGSFTDWKIEVLQ